MTPELGEQEDVEIRLVERQWLDDRRVFGKDIPDLRRIWA
jgi:hypothetical protein